MPVPGSGKKEIRPDAVWCFMVSWLRQRRVACAPETAALLETIHEGIEALESYASECLTTYNLHCSLRTYMRFRPFDGIRLALRGFIKTDRNRLCT